MKTLLSMMFEFFKTGLFAIGGGLATLPFLQEIGNRTGWFSNEDLANMVAVSESTPGPIGINMSTYVGFHMFGVPGAILTSLSLVVPSIIVILIVSSFLDRFKENHYVQDAFYGLRAASTGLIAAACWGVVCIALLHVEAFQASGAVTDLVNPVALVLAIVLLILTNKGPLKKLHPVVFLAASAVIGVLFL